MLNFLAFVAAAAALGGDALNGKAANGHYYLASHGRYTEVGYGVFLYSICHGLSAIGGMVFLVIVAGRLRSRSN